MRRTLSRILGGALLLVSTACSPFLLKAPLVPPPVPVERQAPARLAKVAVAVRDDRAKDAILGGGVVGPNCDAGDGVYVGYVSEEPGQVSRFVEDAAKGAVANLGLTDGPEYALEVRVVEVRVDMSRYTGFSPMNCIGYCHFETALKGPDGAVKTRAFKLAYFENTSPTLSMKEVVKEAVSRIYLHATQEAVVSTLLDQFPGAVDAAALARSLGTLQAATEEIPARELVFWLGLTGRGNAAVKERMVSLFHTSQVQRVRQGAAEAVGMLGLTDQKEEVEAVLTGRKKLAVWDVHDAEEAWYLLKALHLLGENDLAAKVPGGDYKGRHRLPALAAYLQTGTLPPLSPKEIQGLAAARGNVK